MSDRPRAAQLARRYRDQENLTIAEIARRLGRDEATVKAYLDDPTGEQARAVKARCVGVCRGCGPGTRERYKTTARRSAASDRMRQAIARPQRSAP